MRFWAVSSSRFAVKIAGSAARFQSAKPGGSEGNDACRRKSKYRNYGDPRSEGGNCSGQNLQMKTRLMVSLLVAASLPACTTVKTTSHTGRGSDKRLSYAGQPVPPGEYPEGDIPAEGPPDINANPAYIPTPLLRTSAAGGL